MAQFCAVLSPSEKGLGQGNWSTLSSSPSLSKTSGPRRFGHRNLYLYFIALEAGLNWTFQTLFVCQIFNGTENEIALEFEGRAIR